MSLSKSDADFHRSVQILLRHGFVVPPQRRPQEPVLLAVAEDANNINTRGPNHIIHSSPNGPITTTRTTASYDNGVMRRRVSWDLSRFDSSFPSLPFARDGGESSREHPGSLTNHNDRRFQQRRSSLSTVLAPPAETEQEQSRRQSAARINNVIPIRTTTNNDKQKGTVVAATSSEFPADFPSSSSSNMQRREESVRIKITTEEPLERRRRSSLTTVTGMCEGERLFSEAQVECCYHYSRCRDDYYLGDVVTSASHMVIEHTPERAIQAVDGLQTHNFAWVKRSNGLYTYAILAYRSCSTSTTIGPSTDKEEEYMYFVLNNSGLTKMIRKNNWHQSICLVSGKK